MFQLPAFLDIYRNIDLMGFDFFSFPLTIPRYQFLSPDQIKNSFLFLLSLSVSVSEVVLARGPTAPAACCSPLCPAAASQ